MHVRNLFHHAIQTLDRGLLISIMDISADSKHARHAQEVLPRVTISFAGLTRFFMLNKTQKAEIIKELQDKLNRKEMAVFVSLQGVNVKDTQAVRRQLTSAGSELLVVKKTLLGLVLKELGISVNTKEIEGTFGIAFDYESQAHAVKILSGAAKKTTLKMVSAIWQGASLSQTQLKELATLPDINTLRLRLVVLLTAPVRNLLMLVSYEQRKLLLILNHLATKKESLSTSS